MPARWPLQKNEMGCQARCGKNRRCGDQDGVVFQLQCKLRQGTRIGDGVGADVQHQLYPCIFRRLDCAPGPCKLLSLPQGLRRPLVRGPANQDDVHGSLPHESMLLRHGSGAQRGTAITGKRCARKTDEGSFAGRETSIGERLRHGVGTDGCHHDGVVRVGWKRRHLTGFDVSSVVEGWEDNPRACGAVLVTSPTSFTC